MQSNSVKTTNHYAKLLNVSPKTISRDIEVVNGYFSKYSGLVVSTPGIGIELNMIEEDKKLFRDFLIDNSFYSLADNDSIEKRRDSILLLLLDNSDIHVQSSYIYDYFYISKTVFHEDMKVIKEAVKLNYDVEIYLDNKGIKVLANEDEIRSIITSTIIKYIQINTYYKKKLNTIYYDLYDAYLYGYLDRIFNLDNFY